MGIALFLATSIAALGLFAGFLQSKLSPEEMKGGSRYFPYIRLGLMKLIIIIGVIYSNLEIALIAAIASYFAYKGIPYVDYFAFSLIAALSLDISHIILPIIFLYGLPAGSLLYSRKKPFHFIAANIALFLVLSAILPLLLPNA